MTRLPDSTNPKRVIIREEFDRRRLSAIAHEGGCTAGVIPHDFQDQPEFILFALNQIIQSRLMAR